MISRFAIHFFDTLPSTQILARQWCDEGKVKTGDVVCAGIQTAGYGRQGREWQSPQGNLYFTLVDDFEPAHVSWLSYALGLAVYDSVQNYLLPDQDLRLKWPNDILLNGAKLAGMLLEVIDERVLIGVGVNIATAPESNQQTVALVGQAVSSVDAVVLLEEILAAYEKYRQIGLEQGFIGLRDIWLERAIWINNVITARLVDGRVLTGDFVGLDANGALVLNAKGAHHVITSADIYLTKTL